MSSLPLDILRLLPQWLLWEDYFRLNLVCKLWHSIYSIPKRVPVLLEHWGLVSLATVVIGYKELSIPSPKILKAASKDILDGWEACYYVWWSEVYLSDLLKEYREETTWVLCNEPEECHSRCLEINPGGGDLHLKKCVRCFANEVIVNRVTGDLTRSFMPSLPIDYTLAFAKAMIGDVTYQRYPKSCCYLSISDQGEWMGFGSLHTGSHVEQIDTRDGDIFGFCIVLRRCHPDARCCDMVRNWRSPDALNLYTPLRRVIVYVLHRMRQLGLSLRTRRTEISGLSLSLE